MFPAQIYILIPNYIFNVLNSIISLQIFVFFSSKNHCNIFLYCNILNTDFRHNLLDGIFRVPRLGQTNEISYLVIGIVV